MNKTLYIEHGTKKFPVIISDAENKEYIKDEVIHVKCEIAGIDQDCKISDLLEYIDIMSDLITERLERERDIKENSVRLRLSNKERNLIELRAKEGGYKNLSSYIRDKILQPA